MEKSQPKPEVMLVEPYTVDIVSGASRRFEQLSFELKNDGYKVTSLYIPLWCKRWLTKKSYNIFTRLVLSLYVDLCCSVFIIRKGVCISDLNPSMLALVSKHMIIQVHDIRWHELDMLRHPRTFYIINRLFICNYARMLTVSKTMGKSLYKLRRGKSTLVHCNSVSSRLKETSYSLEAEDCVSWARTNGLAEDWPTYIFVARIEERKNHLELIDALSMLKEGCNLVLVGSPIGSGYIRLVEERIESIDKQRMVVRHCEELSDRDLCCAYLVSSLYVSTSIYEGFGIPQLEARHFGVPLLLRDIEINREVYSNAAFFSTKEELAKKVSEYKPVGVDEIRRRIDILREKRDTDQHGHRTVSKWFLVGSDGEEIAYSI